MYSGVCMKITKNKFGKLFIELNEADSLTIKRNFYGKYTGASIPLGDLEELAMKVNTPLLEDIFFLVQAELQERDRQVIDITLGDSANDNG